MYKTTVCNSAMKRQAAAASCCGTATVPAGSACTSDVCGDISCDTQQLAMLTMADQEYLEGFCPAEALACGTMFPCLVM